MNPAVAVELGVAGTSCPNMVCARCGRSDGHIVQFGKSRQGRQRHQRYRCKDCGACFNECTGALFYGKDTEDTTILEVLSMIADRMRISK